MSLIFDALRANRKERGTGAPDPNHLDALEGFFPFTDSDTARARSRALIVICSAATILLAGGVVFWSLRSHGVRPPVTRAPAVARIAPPIVPTAVASAPAPSVPFVLPPSPRPTVSASSTMKPGAASTPMPALQTTPSGPRIRTALAAVDSAGLRMSGAPAPSPTIVATDLPSRGASARVAGVTLQGPPPQVSDRYVNQGIDAMEQGNLAAAEGFFTSALESGASRELFFDWALLKERKADWEGAADKLRHALAIDPTWTHALVALAAALDTVGHPADATATLDRALQIEPSGSEIKIALAAQHVMLSDGRPEAKRLLRDVLAAEPGNASAHILLSRVLLTDADTTGAIREGRAFLRDAGTAYSTETKADVSRWLDALAKPPLSLSLAVGRANVPMIER